jgi:hypothetical protein
VSPQVPLSTHIVWQNADSAPHTATSGMGPNNPDSGRVFDTGIVNSGQSSEPLELVDAAEGDQVPYYCKIHPYRISAINVVPSTVEETPALGIGDSVTSKHVSRGVTAATSTTATTNSAAKDKILNWRVMGDWFDVCKCSIPCPCEFAQAPFQTAL